MLSIKEDLRKKVMELPEKEQEKIYLAMVKVRKEILKESKTKNISKSYLRAKEERNKLVKKYMPSITLINRVVIASLWVPLSNKFG